jgi:hypothetical protein
VPAAFNLGVWRQGPVLGGVLYRWVADEGQNGSGFVVLDLDREVLRPADAEGRLLGDLSVDCGTGVVAGAADGVDRRAFMQVFAALLRARARSGPTPETAHAYYG